VYCNYVNVHYLWSSHKIFWIIYHWNMKTWKSCKAACKRTQHCWPTSPNIVGCYMLRPFARPVACCWMLLRVIAQSLKPVKSFSQQLPTLLGPTVHRGKDTTHKSSKTMRNERALPQQCWKTCANGSNIVALRFSNHGTKEMLGVVG